MPKEEISDGYERLADIAVATRNEKTELKIAFRDVIRNYSELTSDVNDFYEKNLKRFPETVEQTANEIYQSSQSFKEEMSKFGAAMTDLSPPERISGFHTSKIFANSTFLLLVAFVSSFIGSYITAPLIGILFLNFGAILIVSIVIPIGAHYIYHNLRVKTLAEKRISSAGIVAVQSILIGFINQNTWMKSSPMTITTQIVSETNSSSIPK
uniref:DUF1700 domain-containing protein n=1 Tax=Caenorhabditis tropicalis TaxID=1561998 RepID=A0A1I7U8M3_9PELO